MGRQTEDDPTIMIVELSKYGQHVTSATRKGPYSMGTYQKPVTNTVILAMITKGRMVNILIYSVKMAALVKVRLKHHMICVVRKY